jgi:hypothetical protein
MKCQVCGRQIKNEEANFCEYCGSSVREHYHTESKPEPREQYNQNYSQGIPTMMQMPGRTANITNTAEPEKPVSFLNWLGTYGMIFIPLVGPLIFLIMLFVWAFSGTTPASKKNWARVTLIFVAVMIAIVIVYTMYMISTPMFRDMMNGNFDYNSFYQDLYGTTK